MTETNFHIRVYDIVSNAVTFCTKFQRLSKRIHSFSFEMIRILAKEYYTSVGVTITLLPQYRIIYVTH